MSLTLIDVARYKSLIEQSYSCTIIYFDRPDSFCELVTWPTKISDDTLAFLFNKCNIDVVLKASRAVPIRRFSLNEAPLRLFKFISDYLPYFEKNKYIFQNHNKKSLN